MKVRFTFCLLSLLTFATGAFAVGWEWVAPLPQGNDLYDVQFVSASVGYAVGAYGTLIKTSDAGSHWAVLENDLPWSAQVYSLFFGDEQNGWITYRADSMSCICRTSDGGATWVNRHSVPGESYGGVVCPEHDLDLALVRWYQSSGSALLLTTDGGMNWDSVGPLATDIYQVTFSDETSAWAACASGLWHSTDRGESWSVVSQTEITGATTVTFCNPDHGWIDRSGGPMRTTDGGVTWVAMRDPTPSVFSKLRFVNPAFGVGITHDEIFSTRDGGLNWTEQLTPSYYSCNGVACASADRWSVVGRFGQMYSTENSGLTWTTHPGFDPHYGGICAWDSLHVWIGEDSSIVRTSDGGHSWDTVSAGFTNSLSQIEFTSPTNGWVLAGSNCIYRTRNGGTSWELAVGAYGSESFTGMDFSNDQVGWYTLYVTENRTTTLFVTENGGRTWSTHDWDDMHREVYLVSPNIGWSIGSDGDVYRTTNGLGLGSWQPCHAPGILWATRTLSVVDSDVCWLAVGSPNSHWQDSLYLTTDGGTTWHLKLAGTLSRPVFDSSHRYGMVVGEGESYYTSDGGNAWAIYPGPAYAGKVAVNTVGTAWMEGYAGQLLRFTPATSQSVEVSGMSVPREFAFSVAPNPFNPTTTISFALACRSRVRLEVFDLLGRVAYSADLGSLSAGSHSHRLDGSTLSSGVYFTRVHAGDLMKTQKIILLK